ncbi:MULTISPECIES: NADPH-dependent FMN reductase [unclassified Pedobacter]|uniref:NADPH-dependent FMN reductase n=1 Tax=unclassified Pedobacter TaxID=2628915 RepID=UPI001422B9EE|nr:MULTISPECIES: NADPH-dependent FMN reductase [unclassified Pedobacter]NII86024.1 NAD(P)H-dependent FMN reductase [Pedobacter sp. SG908]NMN39064.1 NAD(P)H-dependent FMN reductase [Pedobacter sp. SG918]
MKKILAISGSTKALSTNALYITAISRLLGEDFEVTSFPSIADIPHFNPDLDQKNPSKAIEALRSSIRQADGIIISTPEYAMGLPGSLKNLLDWTVSSASFSKKPVLALVASTQGEKAYQSIIDILTVIEARVSPLLISFAKAKITSEAVIIENETLATLKSIVHSFVANMENG